MPISAPGRRNSRCLPVSLRRTMNAAPHATMANTQESAVSDRSYSTRIGSLSASVATKCIDQMPMPMAKPPHSTHSFQLLACGSRTRAARSSVPCEAVTATSPDCSVPGCTPMSANRLTVACCILGSGAEPPRS